VVYALPRASGARYDVDAAFMSCEQHERGIHALWPGDGEESPITVMRWKHRSTRSGAVWERLWPCAPTM
jgi:hypothetical protein